MVPEGDYIPLSSRMRPSNFDEFLGQRHLLCDGGLIKTILETKNLVSLILYGPPGTGKTSLAYLLAKSFKLKFVSISAVSSGVKELRQIISFAKKYKKMGMGPILLFIDEIQKFNATQQQILLPCIEDGTVVFIGASVDNPMFALIPAINSRCMVAEFKRLDEEDIVCGLIKAVKKFSDRKLFSDDVFYTIAKLSDGDMRKAYTILEPFLKLKRPVSKENIEKYIGKKVFFYDKKGDQHYDTISDFIKAMRRSDEREALYWLMKMIEAGEDVRFIVRRMLIFASEDIGLADPNALVVISSVWQAVNVVGMPEAIFNIVQGCIYLCRAKKSREIVDKIEEMRAKIFQEKTETPQKFLK